jgi:hypothetical protein
MKPPTAIISYAHGAEIFNQSIVELARQLRTKGVDVELDTYNSHPTQGWAKWMEQQLALSDFIIIVLSQPWIASFNQVDDRPTGARYEGALISAILLGNGVRYDRIALVYYERAITELIPFILSGCSRYNLTTPGEFDNLYAFLTGQKKLEEPPLGKIVSLGDSKLSDNASINTFPALCRALLPIVQENGRLFRDFGPNSGRQNTDEPTIAVRFDLRIWYAKRIEIAENNSKIKVTVLGARQLIPDAHSSLFNKWLSHIDAFEIHLKDCTIPYTEHQFPVGVIDVIETNSK